MPSYPPLLEKLLSEYQALGDYEVRMSYLIECAERFQEVPDTLATRPFDAKHRVPGCESDAYVWAQKLPDASLKFYFAVENPQGISAKALAVVLDETLSGVSPREVANVSPEIVFELFTRNISMGKGQGLMNMVGAVSALAKQAMS